MSWKDSGKMVEAKQMRIDFIGFKFGNIAVVEVKGNKMIIDNGREIRTVC